MVTKIISICILLTIAVSVTLSYANSPSKNIPVEQTMAQEIIALKQQIGILQDMLTEQSKQLRNSNSQLSSVKSTSIKTSSANSSSSHSENGKTITRSITEPTVTETVTTRIIRHVPQHQDQDVQLPQQVVQQQWIDTNYKKSVSRATKSYKSNKLIRCDTTIAKYKKLLKKQPNQVYYQYMLETWMKKCSGIITK